MTFAANQQARRLGIRQAFFGVFSVFILVLLLLRSEVAIEYVTRGLLLCAKTVIPSLFPFMVISEWIIGSGMGERLLARVTRPLQILLGLPSVGCVAVLLGMLCGFPVGTRCATLAWHKGDLTKGEAERVIACSNNPSSAFLISAVGISLWENRNFGIALYTTVLLSSLITGILCNLLCKSKPSNAQNQSPQKNILVCTRGVKLFTDAIASATRSILLVCSYVIFFSALVGCLGLLLGSLGASQSITAPLFAFFELSGGVSQAAALGNTFHAALLTAAAVGWSGISVHCQVLSLCDGNGLSLRPYFCAKTIQAILCPLIFGIILRIFPELMVPTTICTV